MDLKKIDVKNVIRGMEFAEKEGESNIYGIEKEFAFIDGSNLYPLQRIGRQSAYKFITSYGNIQPDQKRHIMPEVFDYMIEVITEPHISYNRAVDKILLIEKNLWTALDHIENEFPGINMILLSSGTLYKPAKIERDNIPEVWGDEKKTYLEEMVRRYGEKLTPQGMHSNISIPDPLISFQYHRCGYKKERGSVGYVEFRNEVYVWLACKLRPFASLIIAIEANSPFDYVIENDDVHTVITGYQSNRWAKLPQIESTNYPLMLKDYKHFQRISQFLIDKGVLIGANNYMPIRPKGERRLGEMPLSFERAAWFHNINLDEIEVKTDPLLASIKEIKGASFIERLKIAERIGWLDKKGYKLKDIIRIWQEGNVRRLLGVPLNRIEIRCEESGGDYEFELAKAAFIQTLFLYLFSNPGYACEFKYTKDDLGRITHNEALAVKHGLDAEIIDPFSKGRISMREFLKRVLITIEDFARSLGTFKDLTPIYELAQGKENEAVKQINAVLKYLGKNPKKTKNGRVIVPEDWVKSQLLQRKNYFLKTIKEKILVLSI